MSGVSYKLQTPVHMPICTGVCNLYQTPDIWIIFSEYFSEYAHINMHICEHAHAHVHVHAHAQAQEIHTHTHSHSHTHTHTHTQTHTDSHSVAY